MVIRRAAFALCLLIGCSGISSRSPEETGTQALSVTAGGVITASSDYTRAGWYSDQGLLSPTTVGGGSFAQTFSTAVSGQVYTQPLISGGTVFVATETNNIYAIDAVTGAIKASRALGTPFNPSDLACSDLTPSIGISGTPVIDSSTNTAYLFSKTYVSGSSGPAAWYAHAVDVATLQERTGFPVLIAGSSANDATAVFEATHHQQRPGLLLLNGVVYAAFGAHCDASPYRGWIVGVTTAGQVQTLWSTESSTTAASPGAGIWQSGSGLVSDGTGQILFATGNGLSTLTPAPGNQVPNQLGEAVVRLTVQADGTLKPMDYFMGADAAQLNTTDGDLGAGGPVALPDSFGTTAIPHLLVQIGKEGYVYLLNRDQLGGFEQAAGSADAVVARLGPYGGVWGRPAVWPGNGGYVYSVANQGSVAVFARALDGSGNPTLSFAGKTSDSFGFGSGSPIVTSNGTTSGTALVWVVYCPQTDGTNSQLRAYDPVPVGGILTQRFSAPIGTASKFSVPGVSNGIVYVGTRDGHLLAFGSPTVAPLKTGPLDFGTVVVGQSATQTITITANQALTLTSFASSDPEYTLGAPSVALPAALTSGATLTMSVTFTPTGTGSHPATLSASTSAGAQTFAMSGVGQAPQAALALAPSSLNLGTTGVGQTTTGTFSIVNQGALALSINSVTLPNAPFTVSGLPAVGTMIGSGQSVTAAVTFAPTAIGTFTDAFGISTNGGSASLALSGAGAAPGILVLSTTEASAGSVPIGSTGLATFSITNTGGSAVTVTKSKGPTNAAFSIVTDIPEGTTIAAGATVTATIRFTPTATGLVQDTWVLDATDGAGVRNVGIDGTGVAVTGVPGPAAGGWTLNGSATLSSGTLILTPATANTAGTAFWPTPVSSQTLTIAFDAAIDSGTGADGMTLIFANPAAGAKPTSVGVIGGGLGFSGIPGIAVALDTFNSGGNPSSNFVGVSDGPTTTASNQLHWIASSSSVPALRGTTRHVVVTVNQGALSVTVDGSAPLKTTVSLAANVLIGFSGGCGGLDDRHAVSNVSITTGAVDGGGGVGGGGSDASVPDAAVGPPEAGVPDAARDGAVDAGADSSGVKDASSSSDSGLADSGPIDSGSVGGGPADSGGTDGGAAGKWQLNGKATTESTGFQLTDTGAYEAGSVFWTVSQPSSAITATFDVSIGGGTGADGLTLVFADPATTKATSVGVVGGGLGFSGITGIAVAFDTFNSGGNPSSNFIGISNGPTSKTVTNQLKWLASTSNIPSLRTASHHIVATLTSGSLAVTIDGAAALTQAVTLPSQVLVGFTAGSGGLTDRHAVDNVHITGIQ